MSQSVLLITPPFTQLNTPYPATAYLKGFLQLRGIPTHQADLGIEVILSLFSRAGLMQLYAKLEQVDLEIDANTYRIYQLKSEYLRTIDAVILFLQNKNPTLAHAICDRTFLPEGSRFEQLEELEWAFGSMGIQDRARHLATLYLEDLGDLIKATIDPHFGFSRYAERLGRTATHFDELEQSLNAEPTLIASILEQLLIDKVENWHPTVLGLSVPFPGNLYAALLCGKIIKKHYPHITVILGGGYANTELRSLSEPRLFDYVDYVCLDDGEAALLYLLEYIEAGQKPEDYGGPANNRGQPRTMSQLKRVFLRRNGKVIYCNGATETDVAQKDTGTPDYSDLPLDQYISVIEVANPMHRLWSDGRWNKLTLAHGCYWGRCSFCDISLDYIKKYEPLTAALLCDRMEQIIAQTQQNGFHFVDEAAPPNLLKEVALEIIRRQLTVVWWTNIRFEKLFTSDLSRLLKASGCIAVAGGLEVASDRLLRLMKKGVTVAQVAQVADGFTRAGIMVHAYLMYGFPTQTEQETIDSLELVRQLFDMGVLQSGFWHRFAMTAHSPVGLAPEQFQVTDVGPHFGGFAENDRYHNDPTGADHDLFSEGLRKSLFNYMHGTCLDFPLQEWFEHPVSDTTITPDFIEKSVAEGLRPVTRQRAIAIWLGNIPEVNLMEVGKGKNKQTLMALSFYDKKKSWSIEVPKLIGEWLIEVIPKLIIRAQPPLFYKDFISSYEEMTGNKWESLNQSQLWEILCENGLLVL